MEHPGWNLELLYSTKSGDNFFSFYRNHNTVSDNNYINSSFYANLENAEEILVVIHNSENIIKQEMIFRGTGHSTDWFAAENIMGSSLWKVSADDNFETFDFNDNVLKIASGYGAEENLFISLECSDVNTNTEMTTPDPAGYQEDIDSAGESKPCAILYSGSREMVARSKAYPALKIKILSKVYSFINHTEWKLVFRFGSGIVTNFTKFYETGVAKNSYFSADVLYREPNIQQQIEESISVMIAAFTDDFSAAEVFDVWDKRGKLTSYFPDNIFMTSKPGVINEDPLSENLNLDNLFDSIGDALFMKTCSDDFDWLTVWCPSETASAEQGCQNSFWVTKFPTNMHADKCSVLFVNSENSNNLQTLSMATRFEIYAKKATGVTLVEIHGEYNYAGYIYANTIEHPLELEKRVDHSNSFPSFHKSIDEELAKCKYVELRVTNTARVIHHQQRSGSSFMRFKCSENPGSWFLGKNIIDSSNLWTIDDVKSTGIHIDQYEQSLFVSPGYSDCCTNFTHYLLYAGCQLTCCEIDFVGTKDCFVLYKLSTSSTSMTLAQSVEIRSYS